MTFIDLSNSALSAVPEEFASRHQHAEIAFFSNNPIRELPKRLGRCSRLRILGFKNCEIEEIHPDALPSSLEWLVLTGNRLTELPPSLARLPKLRKLALAGNQIHRFPHELEKCRALELLRISANNLEAPPPSWLFSMPRLAWCAFAGNPFCRSNSADASGATRVLSWTDLQLGTQLGESPSSIVKRATIISTGERIALKEYRGGLTSDGWPADDLASSLVAGAHPNIISTIAAVTDNPHGKSALALELLDEGYSQVGQPPDFTSCTRDTFLTHQRYSPPFILTSAVSLARALQHLHGVGVLHGDVYAHNCLATSSGETKLGDFGAATVLTSAHLSEAHRRAAEQVEVRAYGCYLDDLLTLGLRSDENPRIIELLTDLCRSCLSPAVHQRPPFSEINAMLDEAFSHY